MMRNTRRGFTLIELLVVLGLLATLAAMAMVVAPGIMERDRSVEAVTSLKQWLEISRARAARDRLPRGVRLIVDTTKPVSDQLWVTECQYIEAPPVLLFNIEPPYPNGFVDSTNPSLTVPAGNANAVPSPLSPRVEFAYTTAPAPMAAGLPAQGTITNRQCWIRGLTLEQAATVINYASNNQRPSLWLPVLGTWHRILATTPNTIVPLPTPATANPQSYDIALTLDGYPDAQLGASTNYVTHYFGIYGPPRPLLGEPTLQLPRDTCVDLNAGVSVPGGAVGTDYDILFAPGGQMAFTPATGGFSHVFLWFRDPSKVLSVAPVAGVYDVPTLERGGEMMILAIKASGAMGIEPVDHSPTDPFAFARQSVSGQ
jgi:prepilin-type N-terminal cleavage/methylation domain-containing protein